MKEEIERIIIDSIPLTNQMYKDEKETVLMRGTILPGNEMSGILTKITEDITKCVSIGMKEVWGIVMMNIPLQEVMDDKEGGTGYLSLGTVMSEQGIKQYAKVVTDKVIEIVNQNK